MTSARSTHLLAALLVLAALSCAAGFARLNHSSRIADDAARAFAQSQAQLKQLSAQPFAGNGGGNGGGNGLMSGATDPHAQINRHLRDAAAAAGVAERLVSIEPGEPNQMAGTDYQEMLVFIRLQPLSLRQLVTFLHEHATTDAAARTKAIELSTARNHAADELWLADVTLAYTSYAPSPPEGTSK